MSEGYQLTGTSHTTITVNGVLSKGISSESTSPTPTLTSQRTTTAIVRTSSATAPASATEPPSSHTEQSIASPSGQQPTEQETSSTTFVPVTLVPTAHQTQQSLVPPSEQQTSVQASIIVSSTPTTEEEQQSPSSVDVSDLVSIIQHATETAPSHTASTAPKALPESSTTGIGDYVASVIGLLTTATAPVPQAESTLTATHQSGAAVQSSDILPGTSGAAAGQTHTSAPALVRPSVLTIGSSIVTANEASQYVVGSQTLAPGSAISVDGNSYSLAPSATALFSNGQPSVLNNVAPSPSQAIAVDGTSIVYSPLGSSAYVFGSQTVRGGESITEGGHVVSVDSTNGVAVIDDSITTSLDQGTIAVATALPTASTAGVLNLSSQSVSYSQLGSSGYVIGSHTVSIGGVATVEGHTVSVQPSGSALVVDGSSTVALTEAMQTAAVHVLTAGSVSLSYSPSGSAYIFGSQVLTPGGVITTSGQTLSLGSSGEVVVDGTQTMSLLQASAVSAPTVDVGVGRITIAGETVPFTESGADVIVGSQTLSPGSVVTVEGEVLTLAPGQSQILVVSASHTSTADLHPTGPAVKTTSALIATSGARPTSNVSPAAQSPSSPGTSQGVPAKSFDQTSTYWLVCFVLFLLTTLATT